MKTVKAVLISIVLIVAWACLAMAADVTFTWDANTEPDLAGYYLYQSNVSGGYIFGGGNHIASIPAGTETAILGIPEGGWYWVLTAFDTSENESGSSNEVSLYIDETAPAPPGGPGGLQCFIGASQ